MFKLQVDFEPEVLAEIIYERDLTLTASVLVRVLECFRFHRGTLDAADVGTLCGELERALIRSRGKRPTRPNPSGNGNGSGYPDEEDED